MTQPQGGGAGLRVAWADLEVGQKVHTDPTPVQAIHKRGLQVRRLMYQRVNAFEGVYGHSISIWQQQRNRDWEPAQAG